MPREVVMEETTSSGTFRLEMVEMRQAELQFLSPRSLLVQVFPRRETGGQQIRWEGPRGIASGNGNQRFHRIRNGMIPVPDRLNRNQVLHCPPRTR